MMRRVTEQELAREPARPLATARAETAEAVLGELLGSFLRDELGLDEARSRELERRFWRTVRARRGAP